MVAITAPAWAITAPTEIAAGVTAGEAALPLAMVAAPFATNYFNGRLSKPAEALALVPSASYLDSPDRNAQFKALMQRAKADYGVDLPAFSQRRDELNKQAAGWEGLANAGPDPSGININPYRNVAQNGEVKQFADDLNSSLARLPADIREAYMGHGDLTGTPFAPGAKAPAGGIPKASVSSAALLAGAGASEIMNGETTMGFGLGRLFGRGGPGAGGGYGGGWRNPRITLPLIVGRRLKNFAQGLVSGSFFRLPFMPGPLKLGGAAVGAIASAETGGHYIDKGIESDGMRPTAALPRESYDWIKSGYGNMKTNIGGSISGWFDSHFPRPQSYSTWGDYGRGAFYGALGVSGWISNGEIGIIDSIAGSSTPSAPPAPAKPPNPFNFKNSETNAPPGAPHSNNYAAAIPSLPQTDKPAQVASIRPNKPTMPGTTPGTGIT